MENKEIAELNEMKNKFEALIKRVGIFKLAPILGEVFITDSKKETKYEYLDVRSLYLQHRAPFNLIIIMRICCDWLYNNVISYVFSYGTTKKKIGSQQWLYSSRINKGEYPEKLPLLLVQNFCANIEEILARQKIYK